MGGTFGHAGGISWRNDGIHSGWRNLLRTNSGLGFAPQLRRVSDKGTSVLVGLRQEVGGCEQETIQLVVLEIRDWIQGVFEVWKVSY